VTTTRPRWWQTAVLYEIYPRSFLDTDGDGVGDLPGVTRNLDYLQWLGVDAIWIAPFYPSPMVDLGYDISDYTDVDPRFGTLADFDDLLAQAHTRGIRVVVDYVPNHTSDQHPWFRDSRMSRQSPKRDWYVWRDPTPDGEPPNHWLTMFGASPWTRDDATGQLYLHSFLPEQPDLNWRNTAVRDAMFDVARFWLDRGVDGFRIDVAPMVMKDPDLRDNPERPAPTPDDVRDLDDWVRQFSGYSHAHPDVHELYRSFRTMLDGYPGDRVSYGELHHPDFATWAQSYGAGQDEINVPFNFHLAYAPWRPDAIRRAIEGVQSALPPGAWANWVLGNHDQPRFASPQRAGGAQAKVGMLLLLSLPGTPTIYYGDEIGMTDGAIDPAATRDRLGRDPERTPMQWDATHNAGFSAPTAQPWLPIAPDAGLVNVATQTADPDSLLNLTRRLIRLRREQPALDVGAFEPFGPTTDGTCAFRRVSPEQRLTVVLNLTDSERRIPGAGPGQVLIGTHRDRDGRTTPAEVELRPNEALIVEAD
jgi:alpha-glucosidase